ncbi:hypothetical protein [Enterococcus sp. 5B3_DIV0040]|uniref:hypothetical protein n=1 Tax=Enterococcus sp. 5B3_DIV0040 TaxID=1834182 RepID=UPI000A339087|nr:hypothetical protein [Enterococcus sp. 5B3_DIV0040]OTO01270.1 hypothetical protein A5883_003587 [Enterococcus sp. 5B3_DIV0040]
MVNYEKKETQALVKIGEVLTKLDQNLEKLDLLDNDEKSHSMKKWIVEKKTIHEIKKIAHEAGRYEKYDQRELQKEIDEMEKGI